MRHKGIGFKSDCYMGRARNILTFDKRKVSLDA